MAAIRVTPIFGALLRRLSQCYFGAEDQGQWAVNASIEEKIKQTSRRDRKTRISLLRSGSTRITDAEYDALVRELQSLEQTNPEYLTPDSPTQRVGGKVREGFQRVPHSSPMLSLDNALDEEELKQFDIASTLPSEG